jgi:hypothetical protein
MEVAQNPESIEKYDTEAPWVGGIRLDFDRIVKKHNGNLTTIGASGKLIDVEAKPDYIFIKPFGKSDVYFSAKLERNEEGKNLIEFSIRTKETLTEERNPDFRAEKLVNATMEYFRKENNIDGLEFRWLKYSDEYEKYREKQKQLLSKSAKYTINEEEVKKMASMETWIGKKVALPHGFDQVRVEEITEEDGGEKYPVIKGYFYKSPSQN